MNPIDILTSLKNLQTTAEKLSPSSFQNGYTTALRHAIELAEIQQMRIDLRLAEELEVAK